MMMFGNNYYGEGHDYLFGTKATLLHTDSNEVHVIPQGAKVAARPASDHGGYKEMTGQHMQNFFDCVRSRKEPVCPFKLGFRTSIACQMAVASYRRQTTVRWDPATEEIISCDLSNEPCGPVGSEAAMDAAGAVSLTRFAVRLTGQVVAAGLTLIALRQSTEAVVPAGSAAGRDARGWFLEPLTKDN